MDTTYKMNAARMSFETGVVCKVDIETNRENVIPYIKDQELNCKLKAINFLIESIDMKRDCREDYEIFEKVMLSILDTVGSMLKVESGIGEQRNLEYVKYLIDEVFENNLFLSPRYEGIFDQIEDE